MRSDDEFIVIEQLGKNFIQRSVKLANDLIQDKQFVDWHLVNRHLKRDFFLKQFGKQQFGKQFVERIKLFERAGGRRSHSRC